MGGDSAKGIRRLSRECTDLPAINMGDVSLENR